MPLSKQNLNNTPYKFSYILLQYKKSFYFKIYIGIVASGLWNWMREGWLVVLYTKSTLVG